MLDISGKLNSKVDQLGKIEDIKEIEVGCIKLDRYVNDISKGYFGSQMKEDIEYLCSSLSKIRLKLTAFYVSLSPYDKSKLFF